MILNLSNSYTAKLAALSLPLAEVIDPLMERGMTLDEAAEHIKIALVALDMEQIRKDKKSVNQVREELGFHPLPLSDDAYLRGIMNRDTKWTW